MGRWLKIIDVIPESIPTKLTEQPSVGSVSVSSEIVHKNISKKIELAGFVLECLGGINLHPQQVIDGLLSVEDERDIINGSIPIQSLRLHIELWLKAGKPHYSGK